MRCRKVDSLGDHVKWDDQTQNDKHFIWKLGAEGEGQETKGKPMAVGREGEKERWRAIIKYSQRAGGWTGEMSQ